MSMYLSYSLVAVAMSRYIGVNVLTSRYRHTQQYMPKTFRPFLPLDPLTLSLDAILPSPALVVMPQKPKPHGKKPTKEERPATYVPCSAHHAFMG